MLGLPPGETFWVPDDVLDLYRRCIPRGRALRAAWPSGSTPGRVTSSVGRRRRTATGCPDGRRRSRCSRPRTGPWPPARRSRPASTPPAVDPRPHARGRRPHRQHRDGHGRRGGPVGRAARRRPDPLRHPRARHGRGDDRDGRPSRHRPGGRHLLRVQRLHARRGPAGRPVQCPRRLLVDPRLDRPGPGRSHPPARRAAGRHAGHARPAGDPPGRRQRNGAGLAHRRRQRRAHRPHPVAARSSRSWPTPPPRPPTGWPGAPTCSAIPRAARPGLVLIGTGSEVQLCLAAAELLASAASPPGWCRSPPGTCSPCSPTTTGGGASRRASPAWPSRRPPPSDGSGTPRPPCAIDRFGASAPGDVAMEELGFTPDHVAERATSLSDAGRPRDAGPSRLDSRRPGTTGPPERTP